MRPKTNSALSWNEWDGGELFERVCQTDRFSENDAAQATWHKAPVGQLHSQSRGGSSDLKLENFLYDAPGSDFLKLIDFGFQQVLPNDQR